MNIKYLSDYKFNEDVWKIFKVDEEDMIDFFNRSTNKNIDEKELKLPNTEINNCKYINYSNKLVYSIINNDCINFLNIYDNKFYEVYNIFFNYKDSPVVLYCCNKNDPFIVVQTSSYMDFQYIFYLNKKEIIKISNSTAEHTYYFDHILITIDYMNNNIFSPVNKLKKYIFFGFNINVGHHLWNEISGLYYFLNNNDYHDKIEGIIIGPHDTFNIETIIKNKYNFNILKFTDIFKNCLSGQIKNFDNIFPIFLNSFYIDKNITRMLDIPYENLINNDNDLNKILEISIDIRCYRRYLIDQDIFYTNLIKRLLNDYKEYKLKINFIGCFQTKTYSIDTSKNNEYISQNIIVNKIIENFNNNENLVFNNLVGNSLYTNIKETINSKIFICTFGTCTSNLMSWLYDINAIGIGPLEAYNWSLIQFDILQKYNFIFSPKEFIIENNGLQNPFNINFELFYNYLYEQINLVLSK